MGTLGTCPGPQAFFLFEGPPTGCGEIIFKQIILWLMLLHDRTNTNSAYLVNLADNGAINAANFLP